MQAFTVKGLNFGKASADKIMNFDPSKYFQKMTKCTVMYTYKVNTISFFNNGLSGINSYM